MKITLNADGSVTIDLSPEIAQGVALAREQALLAAAPPAPVAVVEPDPEPAGPLLLDLEKPVPSPDSYRGKVASDLTKSQFQTWELLDMNRNARRGVTVAAVARELKLTSAAAGQRLIQLYKMGYAQRLAPGRYCVSDPSKAAAA